MADFEFTSQIDTTLFNYLKFHSGISMRLFNKFKTSGSFYINGIRFGLTADIFKNDAITVILEEPSGDIIPENIPIEVLYEDGYILAVNKPPNMVTHPTCYHINGTLANAAAFHYKSQNISIPIRPVIRLDKDTSGIVIFAKNSLIQENIIRQMKTGSVRKVYLALAEGCPTIESGKIDAQIARLPGSIITRYVADKGERAVTNYKVLNRFEGYSLLEVQPETGRTHQIRVHMQYIGTPILGDTLYGKKSDLIDRQALHAYSYSFIHPINKNEVSLTAPLPQDIKNIIE